MLMPRLLPRLLPIHPPIATLVLLGAFCTGALAADGPIPKVMADAPADKGSWRMEVLEVPGREAQAMKAMGPMTMCMNALEATSRDRAPAKGAPECARKLLEDSADRAVIQLICSGADAQTVKSTIKRIAPRSYEVTSEMSSTKLPTPVTRSMKMSYVGPCSDKDAVVKLDNQPAACANIKAQMAQMDPAQCPAGANNAACVQRMTTMRAQLQSICK